MLVGVGVVAAAALIAGTVYMQRSTAQPETVAQAASAPLSGTAADPAAPDAQPAVLKPHPQTDFPPLRLPGYALPRPAEVITAAYRFAAEHPEILTYVPCFCGCERSGGPRRGCGRCLRHRFRLRSTPLHINGSRNQCRRRDHASGDQHSPGLGRHWRRRRRRRMGFA